MSGRLLRFILLPFTRSQDLRGVAPHMFKSLVGKGHAEFSTNHQQDAQEFLLYLLDMIDKIQVSCYIYQVMIGWEFSQKVVDWLASDMINVCFLSLN